MQHAGCGCELAVRAQTAADDDARQALENDAKVLQRRWSCPNARVAPAPLDAECLAARERVARLVGCDARDLGPTCPIYLTRTEWIRDVFRARKWAERGQLREYAGAVPAQLFEGVDVLDESIAACEALRHEKRVRELNEKRAAQGLPPLDE